MNSMISNKTNQDKFQQLAHFDETCRLGKSYQEWFQRKVPILKTIMLVNKRIRILLTTKHIGGVGKLRRRVRFYRAWTQQVSVVL